MAQTPPFTMTYTSKRVYGVGHLREVLEALGRPTDEQQQDQALYDRVLLALDEQRRLGLENAEVMTGDIAAIEALIDKHETFINSELGRRLLYYCGRQTDAVHMGVEEHRSPTSRMSALPADMFGALMVYGYLTEWCLLCGEWEATAKPFFAELHPSNHTGGGGAGAVTRACGQCRLNYNDMRCVWCGHQVFMLDRVNKVHTVGRCVPYEQDYSIIDSDETLTLKWGFYCNRYKCLRPR